jgi:SAM-dependent methyltransferase
MASTYVFDTSSDLAGQHMALLESVLDPPTTAFLDELDIRPGQRCLDLGAGGGSITRWLAERTGPQGTVVAVDTDTDHLVEQPGVQVLRHDLTEGLPVDGPFDVIHARLLLVHMPDREVVFKSLVDALAPGGWLVLGDFSGRPLDLMAAPTPADARLFDRMQHLSHEVLAPVQGIDLEWADSVDDRMVAAGLVDVDSMEWSRTTRGGTAGCLFHGNLNEQAAPLLREVGASDDEMRRYRSLMRNPAFRAWFYRLVTVRGRRP